MFIYEDHMGGFFDFEEKLDVEELYCEQCGDHDHLIGEANSIEEAWKLFEGKIATQTITSCKNPICESADYDGSCPYETDCFPQYNREAVAEFIESCDFD